ncbi:carboxypeptidase [Candidatus Bathyarchaeota archaeon]|nr:carboxypeptidase [Candidatus Bathyarchaeota archaeon]MBS7630577.1 carboxypeptidase [Candidatus Bathyarchaeota archaeon]
MSFFLPRFKEIVHDVSSAIELNYLIRAVNRVAPSKIRIEVDEVTYGLHIIIRFEMERDLFNGRLTVAELPSVWNGKYEDYLRVEVQNDSEGVMQDTHWARGSFGYFPSYALGNIYGGMILEALQRDITDWRGRIAQGSFTEVKSWLREHIYKYGNLYDPKDLLRVATGCELDVKSFIKYLYEKYSKLYGF